MAKSILEFCTSYSHVKIRIEQKNRYIKGLFKYPKIKGAKCDKHSCPSRICSDDDKTKVNSFLKTRFITCLMQYLLDCPMKCSS